MGNSYQQGFGTAALWLMGASALYFSFYLLMGSNSIFVLSDQRHQLKTAETRLADIQKERAALEDKVIRMRPETLDWDMAETEAVKVLGERARSAQITTAPQQKP